RPPGFTPF
uniref:Des-Arg9-[Thr6]-bradykinin n=2 Tax=Phyllomedusinae TaxID=192732 RepID=BRK3_PITHY|nr:RecName: Full=Des-Arg9-[Thr6]-bradykinin; Short=Des-Arg-[Thr6]-bradykinin [Pithecopus hypochondrialis]P86630.1 RecName: Full=Des-Arg9-[Thr6]-bradykinin; Short=Des-Arg-[Thr6]-bradykinin [Phasmahyla jandaia]